MMTTAPNWLSIVGLIYCGVGVALIAAAVGAALTMSGAGASARSRHGGSQATFAALGAAVAAFGYILQASAAFHTLPLNGTVALLLLGLMAALILFGLARMAYVGGESEPEAVAAPVAAVATAPAAAGEKLAAPVKLVSSN